MDRGTIGDIGNRNVSQRHYGGGGIMFLAGISVRGTTKCVLLEGNLNAIKYTGVLDDTILLLFEHKYGAVRNWFIFQQDNTVCHTKKFT